MTELRSFLESDPLFDPLAELTLTRERELGHGGMGTVYLVFDKRLERRAALKVLRSVAGNRVRRFRRELLISARLDHPGIPPIYSAGRTSTGHHYLLMRYVQGQTLTQAVESGTRSERELLGDLIRIAEAVGYAHSQGIVHRDLKPDNVMLGEFGEVLVLDWGLARDLTGRITTELTETTDEQGTDPPSGSSARLTMEGAMLGTPGYMPPEQARGEDAGAQSDVFALGALLSFMLTGKPPFDGKTGMDLVASTAMEEIRLPQDRRPGTAPALGAIATAALAADSDKRYATAGAFAADLGAYLEDRTVSVYRGSLSERLVRWVRRRPTLSVAVLGAVLATGGGLLLTQRAGVRAGEEARQDLVAEARRDAEASLAALERSKGQGVTDRLALALTALEHAQRWHALVPLESEAAQARHHAAVTLGELALTSEQWPLARRAFELARGLGVDEAEAKAGLARVDQGREAKTKESRAAVAAWLTRAAGGELRQRFEGNLEALFGILRYPGEDTVALLATRLDQVSAALAAAERKVLERILGDEAEATLEGFAESHGQERLEILRRVNAKKRGVAPGALESISLRIMNLEIAALQSEIPRGERDVATLCCAALGRLGSPKGSAALVRYLWAEADPTQAVRAAIALVRLDDTQGIADADAVGFRFGTNTPYSRRLARARGGRQDAATPSLTQATTPAALYTEGQRLMQAGKPAEAIEVYTRCLELDPKHVKALSNRAVCFMDLGKIKQAIRELKRAVEISPGYVAARTNLGNALQKAGRRDEALLCYTWILDRRPDFVQALNARAYVLRDLGRFSEALRDADRVLKIRPDYPHGLGTRALIRLALGQVAGALKDSRRAVELEPAFPFGISVHARALWAAGRSDEAQDLLVRALEAHTNQVGLRFQLAALRREIGDISGAHREEKLILKVAPKSVKALAAHADTLRLARHYPEALAFLQRAAKLSPDSAIVLAEQAMLLRSRGKLPQAVALALRAVKADPRHARAHFAQAWALLGLSRSAESEAAFTRGLKLEPYASWSYGQRAIARDMLGRKEEALADAAEALRLNSSLSQPHMIRGLIFRERGDKARAIEALRRYVVLRPKSKVTKRVLQILRELEAK
jgi:tetratricopeptide (TPR) repeat protein/predicted Ser/Thr protein kinase